MDSASESQCRIPSGWSCAHKREPAAAVATGMAGSVCSCQLAEGCAQRHVWVAALLMPSGDSLVLTAPQLPCYRHAPTLRRWANANLLSGTLPMELGQLSLLETL